MSNLFGNYIVGFPTRQLIYFLIFSGSFIHPGAVVYEDEHGVMYVNDDMSLTQSGGDEDEFAHEVRIYFLIGNKNAVLVAHHSYLSRDTRKPVFGVSDQVRHKPACTSSEKS